MVASVVDIKCEGNVGGVRLVEMAVMRCGCGGGCGAAVMVKMVVWRASAVLGCGGGGDGVGLKMMTMAVGGWWPESGRKWWGDAGK
ncbi:hypothetical protein Tco_0943515 [Tanacetum coccineum]